MKSYLCLLLVLGAAACGKIPDAVEQPDAAPTTGKATLIAFHDDQTPVAAAMVVHTKPDGTLVAMTATGADGKVSLDITTGDIASVGWDEPNPTGVGSHKQLFTVIGLDVDDEIKLNNRNNQQPPDLGAIVINTAALPPGASSGNLELGCTGASISPTSTSTTVQLNMRCLDANGKITIVADALDANGKVLQTSVQVDIAPPPNGSAVVMPPWTAPAAAKLNFSVANLPAGVNRTLGTIEAHRHGLSFERYEFSGTAASPGSLSVQTARGYADSIVHSAAVTFPNSMDASKTDGVLFIVAKETYANDSGASYVADFSTAMARVFESHYDSAEQTFSWMIESPGDAQTQALANADVVSIIFPWQVGQTPGGIGNQWVVLAPGSVSSPLKLDLHSLAAFEPPPDAGLFPVFLQALELDVLDGYKDAKTRFGTNFLNSVDELQTFKGTAAFSGELH